jgi:hypothetical protein
MDDKIVLAIGTILKCNVWLNGGRRSIRRLVMSAERPTIPRCCCRRRWWHFVRHSVNNIIGMMMREPWIPWAMQYECWDG